MNKRDFKTFVKFCKKNKKSYDYMAYTGAMLRVISYGKNNQSGHFQQLFYAIYDFYNINPNLKSQAGYPPFQISNNTSFLNIWKQFISSVSPTVIEYNAQSLLKNLSINTGGQLQSGGGWGPTAKILFSLVAFYIDN